ncbi:PHP domain-containing protein [Clostridium sp.]|uniref:PHP domain-containing protein n=1 Tax=Clostridium sp. TaxID=1506 RepID=UPI002FC74040
MAYKIRADLHVHTNISDGSYSSKAIIDMAKSKGIDVIAITNHDTTKGIDEAKEYGKEIGIRVIGGVEISAYDFENNRKVHIIGLGLNSYSKNIEKICKRIRYDRNENTKWQLNKIIQLGYEINSEKIYEKSIESGVLYKQHIMEELIRKGYTDRIYSDLYRKLFKGDGICSRDIEYVDVKEAIKCIKADCGIAVLAHPGQLNSYGIIKELVQCGLDGVEINHPSHNEEDIKKIKAIAKEYSLMLTGGSDFHGKYGDCKNYLGMELCP